MEVKGRAAILLDRSMSMNDKLPLIDKTKLEAAKDTAAKLIEILYNTIGPYRLDLYLTPPDILLPGSYAEKTISRTILLPEIAASAASQVSRLEIEPRPSTPLFNAIKQVAEEEPPHSLIIALTDAEEALLGSPQKAKEALRENNHVFAAIIIAKSFRAKVHSLALLGKTLVLQPYRLANSHMLDQQLKIFMYQLAERYKRK